MNGSTGTSALFRWPPPSPFLRPERVPAQMVATKTKKSEASASSSGSASTARSAPRRNAKGQFGSHAAAKKAAKRAGPQEPVENGETDAQSQSPQTQESVTEVRALLPGCFLSPRLAEQLPNAHTSLSQGLSQVTADDDAASRRLSAPAPPSSGAPSPTSSPEELLRRLAESERRAADAERGLEESKARRPPSFFHLPHAARPSTPCAARIS